MNSKKTFEDIIKSSEFQEVIKEDKYSILSKNMKRQILNSAISETNSDDPTIIFKAFSKKVDQYIQKLRKNSEELTNYLEYFINVKFGKISNLNYEIAKNCLLSIKKNNFYN